MKILIICAIVMESLNCIAGQGRNAEVELDMGQVHHYFHHMFYKSDDFVNSKYEFIFLDKLKEVLESDDPVARPYNYCALGFLLKFVVKFDFNKFFDRIQNERPDLIAEAQTHFKKGYSQYSPDCVGEMKIVCVCMSTYKPQEKPGNSENKIIENDSRPGPQQWKMTSDDKKFLEGYSMVRHNASLSSRDSMAEAVKEYLKQSLTEIDCLARKRYCQVGQVITSYNPDLYNTNQGAIEGFLEYVNESKIQLQAQYLPILGFIQTAGDWCAPGGERLIGVMPSCESCFRCN